MDKRDGVTVSFVISYSITTAKSMPEARNSISIPSSEVELTLERLVKTCKDKNFHPISFVRLLKDFKHKLIINSKEVDLLPLYQSEQESAIADDDDDDDNDDDEVSLSQLQLRYIFEFVVKNGDLQQDDYQDLTDLFVNYMARLSIQDQMGILLYFNQCGEFPFDKVAESDNFINNGIIKYLEVLVTSQNQGYLRFKFLFTVSKFLGKLLVRYSNSKTNTSNQSFRDVVFKFANYLQSNGINSVYEYLNTILKQAMFNTVKNDYSSTPTNSNKRVKKPISNVENIVNLRNNLKVLKLKKIVWLSENVTIFYTPINDFFINSFKNILNISNLSTSMTNTTITFELIVSTFDCLKLSTYKTRSIWKHFLLVKIPKLIKILNINQVNLSNVIINVFETLGETKVLANFDKIEDLANIKELFLKKLISNELIKSNQISKLIDLNSYQIQLQHNHQSTMRTLEELPQVFQSKFEDINTEFVSIEESDVVGFLEKLKDNDRLLNKLGELSYSSILKFVKNNESSKLRRLLISLSINEDILNHVISESCNNPYEFIKPLVEYLDKNIDIDPLQKASNSTKENKNGGDNNLMDDDELMMDLGLTLDDDDEEDGNGDGSKGNNGNENSIQDLYTNFGCIFLILKYTNAKFNFNLNRLQDYCISAGGSTTILEMVINNKDFYEMDDRFMMEVNNKQSKLNQSINEWITVLFDLENGEEQNGISDELISNFKIQDFYSIISMIFKESFEAFNLKLINHDNLKNCFEYFTQSFLINQLLSIIEVIKENLWRDDDRAELGLKLLDLIFNGGEYKSESFYFFQMIKRIVNDDLYLQLKELKTKKPKLDTQIDELLNKSFKKNSVEMGPSKRYDSINLFTFIKYVDSSEDPEGAVPAKFELVELMHKIESEGNGVDFMHQSLQELLTDLQFHSETLSIANNSGTTATTNNAPSQTSSIQHGNLQLLNDLSFEVISLTILLYGIINKFDKDEWIQHLQDLSIVDNERKSKVTINIKVIGNEKEEEENDDDDNKDKAKDNEGKLDSNNLSGDQAIKFKDEAFDSNFFGMIEDSKMDIDNDDMIDLNVHSNASEMDINGIKDNTGIKSEIVDLPMDKKITKSNEGSKIIINNLVMILNSESCFGSREEADEMNRKLVLRILNNLKNI